MSSEKLLKELHSKLTPEQFEKFLSVLLEQMGFQARALSSVMTCLFFDTVPRRVAKEFYSYARCKLLP